MRCVGPRGQLREKQGPDKKTMIRQLDNPSVASAIHARHNQPTCGYDVQEGRIKTIVAQELLPGFCNGPVNFTHERARLERDGLLLADQ